MIHQQYNDPIKVGAIFEGSRVFPQFFKWDQNYYYVKRVINLYSTHNGRERVYFFSLANDTDCFKIEFYTHNLKWYLREHYQE